MEDRELAIEIDVLCARAHNYAAAKGFWAHIVQDSRFDYLSDERAFIGEKIALAHTELSEVIDASRKIIDDRERIAKMLQELRDAVIRCFDIAYILQQYDCLAGYRYANLGAQILRMMREAPISREVLHGKRW